MGELIVSAHLAPSPVGPLRLVARDGRLVEVRFVPSIGGATDAESDAPEDPVLVAARAQLHEYFGGTRQAFDLPLAPDGTDFERAVWRRLVAIPFGATCTYASIAADLERPGAARAVGAANARNPIAIVVPCHRVVGADGTLTGYAGGLERKRWLLAHEGARLVEVAQGRLDLAPPVRPPDPA